MLGAGSSALLLWCWPATGASRRCWLLSWWLGSAVSVLCRSVGSWPGSEISVLTAWACSGPARLLLEMLPLPASSRRRCRAGRPAAGPVSSLVAAALLCESWSSLRSMTLSASAPSIEQGQPASCLAQTQTWLSVARTNLWPAGTARSTCLERLELLGRPVPMSITFSLDKPGFGSPPPQPFCYPGVCLPCTAWHASPRGVPTPSAIVVKGLPMNVLPHLESGTACLRAHLVPSSFLCTSLADPWSGSTTPTRSLPHGP